VSDSRGPAPWRDPWAGSDGAGPEDWRYHADHRSMPEDARRLGLDRHTSEGAVLAFASALDGSRPLHRVVAWVLLVALVGPLLLSAAGPVLRGIIDPVLAFFTW